MRNQFVAALFCCLASQATLVTVWATTTGTGTIFSLASLLAMWYSCYNLYTTLSRREYSNVYKPSWNPWAIAGHPEAVVRFGYGILEHPKLLVGGGCVAWFSARHQAMRLLIVRPRFFLFTHHLVQDSRITALLFESHCNNHPTRQQRWYSWLLRAEYVEYTYNPYAGVRFTTIKDVHATTIWHDPAAHDYYGRIAQALIDHWSTRTLQGYAVDIPECLQTQ